MEQQMTLFDRELPQPLAARLRPQSLEEYAGQTHLLGKGKVLRRLIENDQVSSMIFGDHRVLARQRLHGLLQAEQNPLLLIFQQ